MTTINLHSIRNAFLMRHYPDALNLSQPEIEDYFADKARQAFDDYKNFDTPLEKYADFVDKYDFSKRDYNLVKTYIFGKNHRIFVADHNFQAYSTRNTNNLDELFELIGVAHDRKRENYDLVNFSVIDGNGELNYINIMNISQHLAFEGDCIINIINNLFELEDHFMVDGDNNLTIDTTSSGKFNVNRDIKGHMIRKFMKAFYDDFGEEILKQAPVAENDFYYTMDYDEEGIPRHTVIIHQDSSLYLEDIMVISENNFIEDHSKNNISKIDGLVDLLNLALLEKYRPLLLNEYDSIANNDISILKRPGSGLKISESLRDKMFDD